MKHKHTDPTPLPLWQQAEQKNHAELETADGPLLREFTELSELMSSAKKVIGTHDMNGEHVELTPNARFTSNRVTYFDGRPSSVSEKSDNYTALLPDHRVDSCNVDAQAHRVKGTQQLYLALAIHSVRPEQLQYTIHDGHITDIADSAKQVSKDEISTVKAAFEAITSQIHEDLEQIDSQRLKRKIGRFFVGLKDDINSEGAGGF